ncbi:MAG: sigma-70 family RNA polymerase sigma factor [Siphonobacter sp.]
MKNTATAYSDQQLWHALLDGNSEAWGKLYYRQYRPLRAWALRRFADADLVEDALQDLFIWIWQHRQNLNRQAPLTPYLKFSLKNQILKLLNPQNVPLTPETEILEYDCCAETNWIEQEVEQGWRHFATQSLEELPKRKKQIMQLRYSDGYSIEEICERTGLQYQSVVNAVQLSVTHLRDQAYRAGYNYRVFRRKSR